MVKNWREYLNVASKIAGFALFVMGAWHGIVDQAYAQGCWEFLLAMYCGAGD